jgi:hypothetical protein
VTLRARIFGFLALAAALAVPATGLASSPNGDGPSVAALSVNQIGQTSARVSGVLTASKETTTWWLEYGPSPSFSRSTTPVTVSPRGVILIGATLTGLASGTSYQVRLVAEAGKIRIQTPAVTFTTRTPPASPTLPVPEPTTDPQPLPDPGPGSAPAPAPATPEAPAPAPEIAQTVVVAPQGTISVREPGSDAFHTLSAADSIPVGSVVDARQGAITLDAAQESGPPQRARFGGGRFLVRQRPDADGHVDLYLRGRELQLCSPRGHVRVLASATRTRPKRKLWGSDDHGRFRTHGRDSVATVRGTRWTMTDRCGGTLTRVTEGAVDVRDRRTGRVVRVRAGETHFARHRG